MTTSDQPKARGATEPTEERYRFLTENIPVQIWTSRPDGNLDYVTDQTANAFGVSASQLLDEGWLNVLHPDDVPLAIAKWTHSLKSGDVYEVEFRLKLKDGRYAYHLARAVPQRNADGEIVRWLGTNTNIEEQREAQRRMQALLDEVAIQARESEAALTELRRANELAEERIVALETELRSRK